MSSRKRRCATCRYFQNSNLAGNGWCTHPQRQVSTDVRILVRKNELACRDSWGRDLWASADEGEVEDADDAPVAAPIPTPEDFTIAPEQLDDQVTSVVSSFPDETEDTPYTDDIVVEQTSYVGDTDDVWSSDSPSSADLPDDDESDDRDDEDDNTKAFATALDLPDDTDEINHAYLDDQQERVRVIARGSKDAILRARERHRQMRRPSRPQVTAASDSETAEHPETPSIPMDAPLEEEVITTHPTTLASPTIAPDPKDTGDPVDDPYAYPLSRSSRRASYRTFGQRVATSNEPSPTPAQGQEEDTAQPAMHPDHSEADRFDTVPEIRSDIDLPLLRKRLHAPGYASRADHDEEGSEPETSPSYNYVLERAREIRAANQANRGVQAAQGPRRIEPVSSAVNPAPEPEPTPEVEPERDIEHVAASLDSDEPSGKADRHPILPPGAFGETAVPDAESLPEPIMPTWSHEQSRVVNRTVQFRRTTPATAPAEAPNLVADQHDHSIEPYEDEHDQLTVSPVGEIEQDSQPPAQPRRSFWRSFNFGLRNFRASRSSESLPPEEDVVAHDDRASQSPTSYLDTFEDDHDELGTAAEETADYVAESPEPARMVEHDTPEPMAYASNAPFVTETEPDHAVATANSTSITIEDDAEAWYGDDIATSSHHSRYFGYTPDPEEPEPVPAASRSQGTQTAAAPEPEPEPFRTAFWDGGGFDLSDHDEMDAFRSRLFGHLHANQPAPEEPVSAPRQELPEPTRLYARRDTEGDSGGSLPPEAAAPMSHQRESHSESPADHQRLEIRQLLSNNDDDQENETHAQLAPHLSRSCQTCRDFRPSGDGERGWCNNSWAFTHRQMVNATDLPCQSSIGCWWLPADDHLLDHDELASEEDRAPRIDRLLAQRYSDERAAGR